MDPALLRVRVIAIAGAYAHLHFAGIAGTARYNNSTGEFVDMCYFNLLHVATDYINMECPEHRPALALPRIPHRDVGALRDIGADAPMPSIKANAHDGACSAVPLVESPLSITTSDVGRRQTAAQQFAILTGRIKSCRPMILDAPPRVVGSFPYNREPITQNLSAYNKTRKRRAGKTAKAKAAATAAAASAAAPATSKFDKEIAEAAKYNAALKAEMDAAHSAPARSASMQNAPTQEAPISMQAPDREAAPTIQLYPDAHLYSSLMPPAVQFTARQDPGAATTGAAARPSLSALRWAAMHGRVAASDVRHCISRYGLIIHRDAVSAPTIGSVSAPIGADAAPIDHTLPRSNLLDVITATAGQTNWESSPLMRFMQYWRVGAAGEMVRDASSPLAARYGCLPHQISVFGSIYASSLAEMYWMRLLICSYFVSIGMPLLRDIRCDKDGYCCIYNVPSRIRILIRASHSYRVITIWTSKRRDTAEEIRSINRGIIVAIRDETMLFNGVLGHLYGEAPSSASIPDRYAGLTQHPRRAAQRLLDAEICVILCTGGSLESYSAVMDNDYALVYSRIANMLQECPHRRAALGRLAGWYKAFQHVMMFAQSRHPERLGMLRSQFDETLYNAHRFINAIVPSAGDNRRLQKICECIVAVFTIR